MLMSFDSPESSSVKRASYDTDTQVLTVELGGGTYQYAGFPEELWKQFDQAESKGRFFSSFIRPIYSGRKV